MIDLARSTVSFSEAARPFQTDVLARDSTTSKMFQKQVVVLEDEELRRSLGMA